VQVKIELVVESDTEFGRELHKRQSAAVLNGLRQLAEQQQPGDPHRPAG
jgi:hypothetical protein